MKYRKYLISHQLRESKNALFQIKRYFNASHHISWFQEITHLSPIMHEKVLSIWLLKNLLQLLVMLRCYTEIWFRLFKLLWHSLSNYVLRDHISILLSDILPKMDKNYWRCDPSTPIEGVTFAQLTKLLQVWRSITEIVKEGFF